MNFEKITEEYFKKSIVEGKKWCSYCFDNRGTLTKTQSGDLLCEDCLTMIKLLNEIKNIS